MRGLPIYDVHLGVLLCAPQTSGSLGLLAMVGGDPKRRKVFGVKEIFEVSTRCPLVATIGLVEVQGARAGNLASTAVVVGAGRVGWTVF